MWHYVFVLQYATDERMSTHNVFKVKVKVTT